MKRAGLVVLMLLCALAGGLAAAAPADAPPAGQAGATAGAAVTEATVPAGVVLGDVAVGGLPETAATAAVEARYARPVRLRLGRLTLKVDPATLGVSVPAGAAVAAAAAAAPDATLGLRASVNVPAVKTFVAGLAARYDRKPVDARLVLHRLRPFVTTAKPGLVVEQGPTVLALRTALAHAAAAPVRAVVRRPQPAVTAKAFTSVIVIRRGSNVLSLYRGVRLVRQFHVATGQTAYPTPLGRFQIVVKWKNPWWYPPPDPWAAGDKPTPPGPGNPLGTRWMGLSAPGVGIHGTPEASSIGYSLSHGCIRMLIQQAEWLFDRVTVGTPVFIVAA